MKNLINFILFQLLWISCIFGAAYQVMWPASLIITALLVGYLYPTIRHQKDILFLSICLGLGFLLDSFMAHFNLITYNYNLGVTDFAPFWIISLWAGFALTLNHSMSWLIKKPKLGTVFIILGAPLSYFSAEKLNAIQINDSVIALTIISILWLVVYHIILAVNAYYDSDRELSHV